MPGPEQWRVLRALTYLTQVGLSIATPILLCVLGAVWLHERAGAGDWVFLVAIVLGVGGAAASFCTFAREFTRKK